MRLVVLDEIPEEPELRHAWNALVLGMGTPEVFYTYEWAVAVQCAYRATRKPLLFLAYEGESLVGVVAFSRVDSARADFEFLAATTADYCDFLSDAEIRPQFVTAVLRELRNRNLYKLVLTNLPSDSASYNALAAMSSTSGFKLHKRSAYACARVVLGQGEQRSALKKVTADKKRLRRNLRELGKKGAVSVRHAWLWDEIEPSLLSFERAHVARFLSTGRLSNLIRPERRKFLYELGRELSHAGWLRMSRLFVGDVAVAWNYGFQFPGSWFWYQPTVDSGSAYSDFSPGYCLLSKIVEQACDQPEIGVVDLGLGAEEYKERFATAMRETLYCELNRSKAAHFQTTARAHVSAMARSLPAVERTLRRSISAIFKSRSRFRADGMGRLIGSTADRFLKNLYSTDETMFFEWTSHSHRKNATTNLMPLSSEFLGEAAIEYSSELSTMEYLMRLAQRFRREDVQSFVLLDANNKPVHFCCVKKLANHGAVKSGLQWPSEDAVQIFDCFTATSKRGLGFFSDAIALLSARLHSQGKVPWIAGFASDKRLRKVFQQAGFSYRFSVGRKGKISFDRMVDCPEVLTSAKPPGSSESQAPNLSHHIKSYHS